MIEKVNRYLKSARAMKGLTQADLAERIGRSQSWLSQIEQGTLQPSEVDQALICRALGAPPAAIFPLLEGQISEGSHAQAGN
ncbi:helix-turn-helix domain-containing protein [Acidobacteria bacterium AH-259-D05]|nr:helix-turn-helix domain-containing protein [Acidobacteria bacterium AH-259-D05]